jgi:hypothetical protein
MCALDSECVWCSRSRGCVPGRPEPTNRTGCAYLPDNSGQIRCDCEPVGCPNECSSSGCGGCLQDTLCGWCMGASVCQLDRNALPPRAAAVIDAAGHFPTCPSSWISYAAASRLAGGATAACPPDSNSVWVVALISTCVCTVVVGVVCIFLLFRLRVLGNSGAPRNTPLPGRLLDGIPTFKYTGRAHKPADCSLPTQPAAAVVADPGGISEGGATAAVGDEERAEEEEEEEGTCSICLGEFVEGEELRLLGCLHVFHQRCVDQWLAVSRECPLCKRDVAAAAAAADPATIAGAAFAARQGRTFDAAAAAAAAALGQRRRRRTGVAAWCKCLGGRASNEDEQQLPALQAAAASATLAGAPRPAVAAAAPAPSNALGPLPPGLWSPVPMEGAGAGADDGARNSSAAAAARLHADVAVSNPADGAGVAWGENNRAPPPPPSRPPPPPFSDIDAEASGRVWASRAAVLYPALDGAPAVQWAPVDLEVMGVPVLPNAAVAAEHLDGAAAADPTVDASAGGPRGGSAFAFPGPWRSPGEAVELEVAL